MIQCFTVEADDWHSWSFRFKNEKSSKLNIASSQDWSWCWRRNKTFFRSCYWFNCLLLIMQLIIDLLFIIHILKKDLKLIKRTKLYETNWQQVLKMIVDFILNVVHQSDIIIVQKAEYFSEFWIERAEELVELLQSNVFTTTLLNQILIFVNFFQMFQ